MTIRKSEEFETEDGKWKIYFDLGDDFAKNSCVEVRFSLKAPILNEEDVNQLKQDLKDLGKLRIIKQGRKFLDEKEERS